MTFQVPIRLRAACAKTKEIKEMKQNIPKRTQVNDKRKLQRTSKILQAVRECVREIAYETTQETCPLKKSLCYVKIGVFSSDIFTKAKPRLRGVSSTRSSVRKEHKPRGWESVIECANPGSWLARSSLLVCVLLR